MFVALQLPEVDFVRVCFFSPRSDYGRILITERTRDARCYTNNIIYYVRRRRKVGSCEEGVGRDDAKRTVRVTGRRRSD